MLKPEVLYSTLINKISNNDNKFIILNDIAQIDNALLNYYNYIKRIQLFEKYNKNKTILNLINLIFALNTSIIIKKMFIAMIKSANVDIARKTYNILLKKWSYIKVNIVSSDNTKINIDALKLPNVAQINHKIDSKLIGGNITILNSLKIDSSVAGRVEAIKDQLISSIG